MKNKIMKIVTMSLILMVLGTMTIFAQEHEKMEHKCEIKEAHEVHKMKERKPAIPNLTEEQKKQIKEVKLKLKKETLPLKNELNEKRARLQTLTTTEGTSEKDINKIIEEIGALETKMMKAKVFNEIEVKKSLTEEQRLSLDSRPTMKKRKHKMQH